MAYETFEMSRKDGQPATLYLFQWGTAATSIFAYTDADIPLDHDGITFQPTVIGRMGIEASGSLDRKTLEIDIDPRASIVRMYADNPPSVKVSLTIFQGHVTDTSRDYRAIWTGSVKNLNREPPYAKAVCEPLDGLMARPGLRRYYMYGCPFVLYDSRTCKANPLTHRRTATPIFIGGNFVRFAAGWSGPLAGEKYIGGYVEWTDSQSNLQRRTMEDFGATDNEVIIGNTRQLASGQALTLYAGCLRTLEDCRTLHGNTPNYGGQPFIPLENPVDYVNRFY